ncbi:CGNR zinc finger domain-containing protein [Mumia sp. Pv 4-285]|uniref:CGNR zinc finger domain-containing protein n=1 Tax=Mumia qirimensis TaxID=3234852 RepID=UPI00351D6A96
MSLLNDPCATPAELADRCEEAGLDLAAAPTSSDLEAVGAFMAQWRRVVACSEHEPRAATLNALMLEYASAPWLTDHAGTGWHLHFREPDVDVPRQIAALISVGTALHLSGLGMDRLGICAAGECSKAYADISRNGRQRYCSTTCANREAVRRHRATRASATV